MTDLPQHQVGVRHLRPDRLGDPLTDFEVQSGARHTVAFGPDGVVLGYAGDAEDTFAQARAEQSASISYMLCSLASGAWWSWPESRTDHDRFPVSPGQKSLPADHVLLRHADPGSTSWWWVLVLPASWGGLCTELPPDVPAQVTALMKPLQECRDKVATILRDAHDAEDTMSR